MNLPKTRLMAIEESTEDLIDFGTMIDTVWRGKAVILSVILACIMAAAVYVYLIATPMFRASSVVMMESREAEVAGLDSVLGGLSGETSVVNTEVEVLRGRALLGRVVDEMKLLEDPEFNGSIAEKSALASLRSFLRAAPKVQDPELAARVQRDATISTLLNQTTIRNIPLSLVFQITVETTSAVKSAALADAIARLYIEDQLQVKFSATKEATQWLSSRVSELKKELEDAEAAVRTFRGSTTLIDAETLAAMDRQLKDTRERLLTTMAQIPASTERRKALVAAQGRIAQAEVAADSLMMRLAEEAETNPLAATEFDKRYRDLIERLSQDESVAQVQIESLQSAEKTLAAQLDQQSADLIRLDQLLREADATRLLYEHFQTRLKETAVQQGIQKADSRVLSSAVIPGAASTPRKTVALVLATFIGLVLGALIVLYQEMRAKGIRTAQDLEAFTGRSVLGQIPQIPEKARARALAYLAEKPTSAAAESVRNLRTSILLSDIDHAPQVIALTSSIPGEGKTTMTLALAQNMTGMGKRVLVIEGDIRRRVFSQYFNVPDDRGLIAVLAGRVALKDAVNKIDGMGDVLIGEKTKTNAADLFSSEAFAKFMVDVRQHYDIILIDTPPVLVVPDARVIGQHVDTTVFVVRWDMTTRTQVVDALQLLDSVNMKVAGLVLSQISAEGMRRYGYGDRYGAYAAYGKKYYNE